MAALESPCLYSSAATEIWASVILWDVSMGTDARLGDRFSHAATAVLVLIMVSNSMGVKRPNAA